MSSRGIWGRVRERLHRFPELLESCGEQASIYGKCIASHTAGQRDLKKDVCAKEFEMLMDCFTKAGYSRGP
ncbi:NADH dehydrogenase [ubiquinone] 1 alpha subcomplex assembly factor 8 isoform X2 [Pogona vitticeps]|uniref:NADH dehydrogenase [ubiquinone] 1 alpha subcomplex assembly factor 8 isoform X2 n=1 Tax=Pogona vitticeps TaxID=103695 RepID=A0A6J0V895_9SAUR